MTREKVLGFPTRSDTNRPAQPQMVRSLKFWKYVDEELYYLCDNKGADQLCSYFRADLRLCFRIGKNPVSHDAAYIKAVLLDTKPTGPTQTGLYCHRRWLT